MIANQSRDKMIIDYLKDGLDPAKWSTRVRWQSPNHSTSSNLNIYLARASMQALGLAASPEALDAIRSYKCDVKPCPLEDVRGDALRTCHDINQMRGGLAEYYGGVSAGSGLKEGMPVHRTP
jgi:hypothetical protein